MLMVRLIPFTSTLARWFVASTISTTWPGMPRHMTVPSCGDSADPGQRVAHEHVDDPAAAECGAECDHTLGFGDDLPDDSGLGTSGEAAQCGHGGFRLIGRHDGDELAL